MQIFTAIKHSSDPRFYLGSLWSGNFCPAFRELGHEIVESRADLLPASRFMHIASGFTREEKEIRAQITEQIVEEVKKSHREKPIDLFLSYFYNAHFDPAGFNEIHRLGIPTVNFYCNSMYQFKYVEAIARKVNFSWHTERDARAFYLKVGANPVWVQMGADPEVYHPIPETRRESKACFVGQRYADRDRHLARLIRDGVPVDIFGQGWGREATNGRFSGNLAEQEIVYLSRKQLRPGGIESYLQAIWQNIEEQGIFGGSGRTIRQWQYRNESRKLDKIVASRARGLAKDVAETFNRYEIVLNFIHVWSDGRPGSELIPHMRLRDFEAPMCRSCYLTGRSDEISEFYEIGKEIDTYQSPEELIDKTKFYLAHPAEADKMRGAGYQRARRDHTWTKRLQQLFHQIGLTQPV